MFVGNLLEYSRGFWGSPHCNVLPLSLTAADDGLITSGTRQPIQLKQQTRWQTGPDLSGAGEPRWQDDMRRLFRPKPLRIRGTQEQIFKHEQDQFDKVFINGLTLFTVARRLKHTHTHFGSIVGTFTDVAPHRSMNGHSCV